MSASCKQRAADDAMRAKTAVAPLLPDRYNPGPMKSSSTCVCTLAGLLMLAAPAWAQYRETVIVDDSRDVLNEIMAIPASGIPASLLANAQGIVIIPDLVKGGFIVGVRHGRGIVMVRDERGFWRPPSFVTLTGGSVGWQIGLQVTDIVLVFKTRSSVQGLLNGKFTIGADAAAAAGPVGREAAAATDAQLLAEIFTWSRSRGLFAGVSLDGSVLQIDHGANTVFYGGANVTDPHQAIPVPASAIALMRQVGYYAGTPGESLVGRAHGGDTESGPHACRRDCADARGGRGRRSPGRSATTVCGLTAAAHDTRRKLARLSGHAAGDLCRRPCAQRGKPAAGARPL